MAQRRLTIEEIWHGLIEAFRLITSGDPAIREIVFLSLKVTGIALILAVPLGVSLGSWVGLSRFFGRSLVIALFYTGMGFPPVVIGLFLYLLLSRGGPLGELGWLFNPEGMILSQVIISFPLIAGFTMSSVLGINPNLRQQLISLGATRWQATLAILQEAKVGIIVAIVAGFGAIISEVGAAMIVGGNIEGHTRVLTTAIVQLTRMGIFDLAMALGIILLAVCFVINLAMLHLQRRLD